VVRFVVPLLADALPIELYVLSGLSLLTAVYGAAVGLVQREVRPALGYLAMSQSALSLAGLTGSTPDLLVGGLLMWISSGLALTGLGLSVWMLEARAGTLSLRQPGGHYRTAPALAVCFLFFGLASVGFPGTLSFVADDLLISAALGRAVGPNLALVAASAMNAVAVLRAWFTLFGGPASPQMSPHELVPRERVAAGGLILLIVALGLSPGPLLHLLERAATELAAPLISAP
jgi:NADH-quinone oxidoreductase subunit M